MIFAPECKEAFFVPIGDCGGQSMRTRSLSLFLLLPLFPAHAQDAVPTFQRTVGGAAYTFAGRDPAQGGSTTIPTLPVPITLSFEAKTTVMEAGTYVVD